MGWMEFVMDKNQERNEWRQRLIFELLRHNVVYGKQSIDDLVDSAKKIEEFVFGGNQQQSSLVD